MKPFIYLSLVFILALSAGCSKESKDRSTFVNDQSNIESKNQTKAEDQYLARRSSELEIDLAKRQLFYKAVVGTYLGTLKTEEGVFNIRFTFVPSLPLYQNSNRFRPVEEVVHDLTNLFFTVQVKQWNPNDKYTSVGCRFTQVRPDLVTGEINLASEGCNNFYKLHLSGVAGREKLEGLNGNLSKKQVSTGISAYVLSTPISSVTRLEGTMEPTTNAAVYTLSARRVE